MKRAIFILSQKGGSGKTTFSRALLDHLRLTRGLTVAAFDADGAVGQLLQYYGSRDGAGRLLVPQDPLTGVGVFNLRRSEERGMVVDALDCGADTLLFDFPAGSLDELDRVEGEAGVEAVLDEYDREGWRVTVVVVVSNVQSSAGNVLAAIDTFGDRVDYVAVKNLFYGKPEDFLFFDGFTGADGQLYGGQAREALTRHGGAVIAMPALAGRAYALCDLYCLGFSEATCHPAIKRSDRGAVAYFLRAFGEAVDAATPFFGYALTQTSAAPAAPVAWPPF